MENQGAVKGRIGSSWDSCCPWSSDAHFHPCSGQQDSPCPSWSGTKAWTSRALRLILRLIKRQTKWQGKEGNSWQHGKHFGHFKKCSKESPAGKVWKFQALPAGDSLLAVVLESFFLTQDARYPVAVLYIVMVFLWNASKWIKSHSNQNEIRFYRTKLHLVEPCHSNKSMWVFHSGFHKPP